MKFAFDDKFITYIKKIYLNYIFVFDEVITKTKNKTQKNEREETRILVLVYFLVINEKE